MNTIKSYFSPERLTFILFACLLSLSATVAYSQSILNTPISISVENETLKKTLQKIESISEVTFMYTTKDVDVHQKISLQADKKNLRYILDTILKPLKLEYTVNGNRIIIKAKQTKPRHISGKITAAGTGEALVGVNILIKGTGIGTVSDANGNYILQADEDDAIVRFSLVGYTSLELPADSLLNDIQLEQEATELQDLVIVGYGSLNQQSISGAISSLDLNKATAQQQPVSTLEQMLQGRLAGVNILQNSGNPGSSISVRIRGTASINASNAPLYVIDGTPINYHNYAAPGDTYSAVTEDAFGINVMPGISPDAIASIEVLKDASAAAIYGSRGSNGVVLITTKTGKPFQDKINLHVYHGWQEVQRTLPLLQSAEYAALINEAKQNKEPTAEPFFKGDLSALPTTDWQQAIFRHAPLKSYEISSSGGNDRINYFLSGGYMSQDGIIIGSGFQRYNALANLNFSANSKWYYGLKLNLSRSITQRVKSGSTGVLGTATRKAPTLPVFHTDGSYFAEDTLNASFNNPVALASIPQHYLFNNRIIGNAFAEYSLTQSLTARTSWSIDYMGIFDDFSIPKNDVLIRKQGTTVKGYTEDFAWLSEHTLNYQRQISQHHNFTLLAGISFQESKLKRIVAKSEIFPLHNTTSVNSGSLRTSYGRNSIWGLSSYFFRANYVFRNRYLVTASQRIDGSSKFAKTKKFGQFPSLSLGWRLSEESFIKSLTVIDNLKLRASWGVTGNQSIPNFVSQGIIEGGKNYLGESGIALIQLENPALTWESTTQTNLGIDVSLFQDKLSLTCDVYKKKTTNTLLEAEIPQSSGFAISYLNIGEIENKGVEFQVGYSAPIGNTIEWNSSFTIAFNRNVVKKLPTGEKQLGFFEHGSILREGYPLGSLFGLKVTGIDSITGNYLFYDNNGDQNIPFPTMADRVVLGNPHPKFIGGFINELKFSRFELGLSLQFVYGNKIFNASKFYNQAMKNFDNGDIGIRKRWTNDGNSFALHKAVWDDPYNNTVVSDRAIEDGSFLRAKIVTLGYYVAPRLLKKLNLSTLQFYITAQNLWTFTKYSGFDPEVNEYENDTLLGFDRNTCPQPRTYILGVKLAF
jgi:TonB-linked SusC/RagA family outer membrane protein